MGLPDRGQQWKGHVFMTCTPALLVLFSVPDVPEGSRLCQKKGGLRVLTYPSKIRTRMVGNWLRWEWKDWRQKKKMVVNCEEEQGDCFLHTYYTPYVTTAFSRHLRQQLHYFC